LSFAENLVILQQEQGVTNYKLAKALGVHCSTIKNWRNGKMPLLEHAYAVAAYFGKTVDEMMANTSTVKD
jgi:DNA-binding XRE family transcriptional regulator